MAQGGGQMRTFRTELAHGITLVKEETDYFKNFELLDQINTYKIENDLDVGAAVTVDITGSDGVNFNGPLSGKVFQQTQSVDAKGKAQLCELRLFSDWQLKIKFTYELKDVSEDYAAQVKLEPTKARARHHEEEVKQAQLKEDHPDHFGGEIAQQLVRCREAFKVFSFDQAEAAHIQRILKENDIANFVDIEFPPMMVSLHNPEENFPYGSDVCWKRAKEFLILGKRPEVFGRAPIQPSDILAGSLGDTWFASALACLAEKPSLIKKMFLTSSYCEDGVYKLQLWKGGLEQELTIDDYFPVSNTTGNMALFTRSSKHEMWVLLLEKAYAKIHRNYFTLRGGLVSDALADLTGAPTELITLNRDETKRDVQQGRFFLSMNQHLRDGHIVAASTEGEELWAEIDNYQMPNGLLKAHAYNLLEARSMAGGQNLYKVRDVWSKQSQELLAWQGTFSKGSAKWTADLAHELDHDLEADDHDYIWMTEQEFAEQFATITICRVNKDHETLRFKGEFLKGFSRQNARFEDKNVRSKYQYEVQLEQKQKLSFIMHQTDIRIQGIIRRQPYMSMGMSVFQQDPLSGKLELITTTPLCNQRQTMLDVELMPGRYYIVPRTSGVGFQKPIDAPKEGKIALFKKNGEFNELVEITLRELFRRLDRIQMGGGLDVAEFNDLMKKVGHDEKTADFFRYQVLQKHARNAQNELSLRGFLDWFRTWIQQEGLQKAPKIFEMLGYDEDLYPIQSRAFTISIHSPSEILLYVQDRTASEESNPNPQLENIEETVNREMVKRYGSSVETEPVQYELIMWHNEHTDTFSFGLKNLKKIPAAFTLDCSASQNMVFAEVGGKVTHYVKSGEFIFMMHLERSEDVEEFTVQYVVIVEEI